MKYEKAVLRLEEIIAELNSQTVSLDDSIKLFTEGAKLISLCDGMLKQAEVKIETLSVEGEANDK